MSNAPPIPQGNYVSVFRHGDLVVTSGITPRVNGELRHAGRLETGVPLETYRPAVTLAARNVLAALESALQDGERIAAIMQATVYLAASEDFVGHAKAADFASEVFVEALGPAGRGTRAAIGVASLPGGASVEISVQAIIAAGNGDRTGR